MKWTIIDPDGFNHCIFQHEGVWHGWQNLPTDPQVVVTALYTGQPLPEGYRFADPD